MIVNHSCRLHVGIAHGGADKLKTALFQISAQGVGLHACGTIVVQALEVMHDGLSVDETPDILVEATELFLHGEETLGVVNSGKDLCPVTDDARIVQQQLELTLAKARDLVRFETGKGRAIILSFSQDRVPAQARLRCLQDEKLKDQAVVMNRHAPLAIVVLDVIILGKIDPRTTIDLF